MEASTDPPVARMDTHKYTLDSGVVTTWLEDSHQTTKVLLSLSCMPAALLLRIAAHCRSLCMCVSACVHFLVRVIRGSESVFGFEDSAVTTSQVLPE